MEIIILNVPVEIVAFFSFYLQQLQCIVSWQNKCIVKCYLKVLFKMIMFDLTDGALKDDEALLTRRIKDELGDEFDEHPLILRDQVD